MTKLRVKQLVVSAALAVMLVLTVLSSAVWGAVSDLRSRAYIKVDGAAAHNLLELPDEVLSQSQLSLGDLRIYAGEEEIPFALVSDQEPAVAAKYEKAAIYNRGTDYQGNLIFEIRNEQGRWISQLNFNSKDKNFIRQVKLEGSGDQQDWVTITPDSTIFDLSGEQKNRHTEINFVPTNFRYLRITIFNAGKGSFQPDGIELLYAGPNNPFGLKDRSYSLLAQKTAGNNDEYILDLNTAHLPSRELELVTDDENFSREVEIYSSDNATDWKLLIRSEAYSYRFENLAAKQLSFRFRTDSRYLRCIIHNQDNRPLAIREFKIRGINPALIFPVDSSKSYYLYWNSGQIKAPVYDLQKIKDYLEYSKLPRAELSAGENNEAFQFKDTRPWTERNAWLLQLLLIVAAVVLLAVIVFNIRKITTNKP